jgi:hypothetical protein
MAATPSIAGVYPAIHQCHCESSHVEFKPHLSDLEQFFGSAFMSFMAVAYVPAFLEDRATFAKERANGLYGATPFMVSNFIVGLPFLCMYPVPPAV